MAFFCIVLHWSFHTCGSTNRYLSWNRNISPSGSPPMMENVGLGNTIWPNIVSIESGPASWFVVKCTFSPLLHFLSSLFSPGLLSTLLFPCLSSPPLLSHLSYSLLSSPLPWSPINSPLSFSLIFPLPLLPLSPLSSSLLSYPLLLSRLHSPHHPSPLLFPTHPHPSPPPPHWCVSLEEFCWCLWLNCSLSWQWCDGGPIGTQALRWGSIGCVMEGLRAQSFTLCHKPRHQTQLAGQVALLAVGIKFQSK